MVLWLERHGFSQKEHGENNGIHFVKEGRDRVLTYNPANSTYRYVDRQAEAIGMPNCDIGGLRAIADSYLGEIVDEPWSYTFMNIEMQQSRLYGETEKRTDFVTFRYVPNISGRLVMGTASHVKLKLGRNGCLSGLTKAVPGVKEHKRIGAEVKSEAFAAIICNIRLCCPACGNIFGPFANFCRFNKPTGIAHLKLRPAVAHPWP